MVIAHAWLQGQSPVRDWRQRKLWNAGFNHVFRAAHWPFWPEVARCNGSKEASMQPKVLCFSF